MAFNYFEDLAGRVRYLYSTHLVQVLTAHHILNAVLSLTFFVAKGHTGVCEVVLPETAQCGLDVREHQVFVFTAFVIFWKNRRASSWLHYLSNVFLFARLANVVLFFMLDPLYCVVYTAVMLVCAVLFPEPAYVVTGGNITFYTPETLKAELKRNSKCVFVIEFFANWSPECRRMTTHFAKLSSEFSSPKIKFGKLDVGRFAQAAEIEFRINTAVNSRQLPTVALFRSGRETMRRPLVKSGRAVTYNFSVENMTNDFDLTNIAAELARNAAKPIVTLNVKAKKNN